MMLITGFPLGQDYRIPTGTRLHDSHWDKAGWTLSLGNIKAQSRRVCLFYHFWSTKDINIEFLAQMVYVFPIFCPGSPQGYIIFPKVYSLTVSIFLTQQRVRIFLYKIQRFLLPGRDTFPNFFQVILGKKYRFLDQKVCVLPKAVE